MFGMCCVLPVAGRVEHESFLSRYVYACHRRNHVAPHANCQADWVEMSSSRANGGSQLSSWIS